VKIQLGPGAQLHRLRISPLVQTSRFIFPVLTPGAPNQLLYQDSSPTQQARDIQVTTTVPTGMPQIRGVHAQSLVPESPADSLDRDYEAANLVDDDPDSLAYPGSNHLDYVVELNGSYNVSGISIDWGYFGTDPRYLQSWEVLGRNGDQSWALLAKGGFPNEATMDLGVTTAATAIRVIADSSNWIGAYGLRVFGGATAAALPTSSWSIHSNVAEDPIYSIGGNYQAANLIDGDPNTLAYPASSELDYQISLGGPAHISSADITWGYFGSDARYISSWSLLARNGSGQPWLTVAQGGFPNAPTTHASFDALATEMRIIASSNQNWIGIYDLSLNGGQLMTGLGVSSNIPELTTQANFRPAANLVDGDENSFAYPASTHLDYAIDPGQNTYFDEVRIVWGVFGTDSRYVQTWRLLGLRPDDNWEVVTRGTFPNSNETIVPVHNRYRKLRIAADGPNWLAIYEFQAFGVAIAAAAQARVKSNVVEDPVYSLSRGLRASNLIDGVPNTLAYPASPHLDYQIALGQVTRLSSILVDWGAFGTNPSFVNSWSLLARSSATAPWSLLATGGYPDNAFTVLSVDFSATDLRVIADSANWIGIYELQIKGTPQQ
jgi:hypothetical protein